MLHFNRLITLILFTILTFSLEAQNAFITTWKTDNSGSSLDHQFTIPTNHWTYTYNYDVYWEEVGNPSNNGSSTGNTEDVTISISPAGVYRVEITGVFPAIQFKDIGDKRKILTIEQWGDNSWQSFRKAFNGCSNLTYNATDTPDLSNVTNLDQMFEGASIFDGNIGNWDVSSITSMYALFKDANLFNQDINNWNVANVTNMRSMFEGTNSFNQYIGDWDVSNVTSMSSMFENSNYNQDLNGWDVGNVLSMSSMFYGSNYNQDLNSWDVSKVESMSNMFRLANDFNGQISNWNVGSVTDMEGMFDYADSFNQDIGSWNVSSVQNMSNMFQSASLFNQDLNSWNVSSVTDMSGMFRGATSFNGMINNWDVSNVTSLTYMFKSAESFNQDIGSWDISLITSLREVFFGASSFNQDLTNWNVSNVTGMTSTFSGASSFNGNLSAWDVSNVTSFKSTFEGASSFNRDIGNWNVSSAVTMESMFNDAYLFDQDISNWDVSDTYVEYMFRDAGLSNCNYDILLIQWSQLNLDNNISFYSDSSTYSSGNAESARQSIIDDFSWDFTDDGMDVDGCPDASIIGNSMIPQFSAFPNPTRDNLTVTYYTNEDAVLFLYTANGQILFKKELDKSTEENSILINLKDNSEGVYFIKLVSYETVKTEKIILTN